LGLPSIAGPISESVEVEDEARPLMAPWSPASRRAFLALAGTGLAAALAACRGQRKQDQHGALPRQPTPTASTTPRASGGPTSTTPAAGGPARAVFHGPRDGRQVALTFHCSGDPALVMRLLDLVAREHVPITVFAVGRWLDQHPEMAARILAGGHELGNHTFTHPPLGQLGRAEVDREILRCRAVLERLAGGGRYFRPSGMTTPTPLVLAAAGLAPGSIVSLHTGHAGTVAAMPRIIAAARARGLKPVPVHRLLEHAQRRSP
jgi:peptidoglycan/xylan/chitin deacetylase (PgdA/CDA1 family)